MGVFGYISISKPLAEKRHIIFWKTSRCILFFTPLSLPFIQNSSSKEYLSLEVLMTCLSSSTRWAI